MMERDARSSADSARSSNSVYKQTADAGVERNKMVMRWGEG